MQFFKTKAKDASSTREIRTSYNIHTDWFAAVTLSNISDFTLTCTTCIPARTNDREPGDRRGTASRTTPPTPLSGANARRALACRGVRAQSTCRRQCKWSWPGRCRARTNFRGSTCRCFTVWKYYACVQVIHSKNKEKFWFLTFLLQIESRIKEDAKQTRRTIYSIITSQYK